jgi:hypothetical protein
VESVRAFAAAVAIWGGPTGQRNAHHIDGVHGHTLVAKTRKALDALEAGELSFALQAIDAIKGVGPSYASKWLRHLAPGACVVLDSIIAGAFGLSENAENFAAWSAQCQARARTLGRKWRAADVEACVFIWLQWPAALREHFARETSAREEAAS